MKKAIVAIVVAVCLVGCAAQMAVNTWKSILDPMVGQSKDYVLMVMGAPTSVMQGETIEVWRYYQGFGTESTPSYFLGQRVGTETRDKYDDISVYFRDGIMVYWTAAAQR